MSQAGLRGPAFVRNWRVLMRQPVLAIGVIVLKLLELVAGSLGVASAALAATRGARKNSRRAGGSTT
jgi:hypothetical protein